MTSLLFNVVVRALQPLLLFFSIYLLISGHHEPGGGFAGGLVAASGYVLQAIAHSSRSARQGLRVPLPSLLGIGLCVALASATLPVVGGEPFFASLWIELEVGSLGKVELGTPLLFDVGVYLVVMAITLFFVLPLAEEG